MTTESGLAEQAVIWARVSGGVSWVGAVAFFALGAMVLFAVLFWKTPLPPIAAGLLALGFILLTQFLGRSKRLWGPRSYPLDQIYVSWISAAIIVGGLALRIAWMRAFPVEQWSDYATYWHLALGLADNGEYVQQVSGQQVYYAWRPPGLPLLLAGFIRLLGPQPWIPAIINLLAYVLVSVLLIRLANRLAGARTALIAVSLFALYPSNIAVTYFANTETLSLLVLLWCYWLMITLEERSWLFAIVFGLVLGFGILIRPTFLLLVPIIGVYLIQRALAGKRPGLRGLFATSASMMLGVAIVVGGWAYRNYERLGEPVLATTMGGANFYFANNPLAHEGIDHTERNLFNKGLTELQISRVGYEWGMEWIKDNPTGFVRYAATKFFRMAANASDQIHWVVKQFHHREGSLFQILNIAAIAWWFCGWLLAMIGLRRHWKIFSRKPSATLLFLLIGFLFAVHTVFQAVGRYHMPVAGLLVLLAALGVSPERPRESRWP